MKTNDTAQTRKLHDLCANVRALASSGQYDTCIALICNAMQAFPSAPQPHNLMGVLMEKTGDHPLAMKHFRAASALDPTYHPASQNLMTYGTFCSDGTVAYDECDCRETEDSACRIEYDGRGIGHFVRGR